ncbi:MAG: hypothetical protein J1E84_01210 [Muribaculaceae bacterium]|nr:hypothetical protein [Muribaculaceae bacterium]
MAIFHPEAQFTWLFGEIEYFLGLFIIAAFLLFTLLYNLGETRDEKYYFTPDGKLDLSTPRYYTKLKRHKLFELITKKGNVDEFAYDGEGNVYIKFRKGKELVAPLEDLTVSYTMGKDRFSDDWYVYKMKITTPEGAEYKVKLGPEIEEAEFEDIFMILSTAGTLKESNISKATKWMSKLKDSVEGFDFSDLVGSGIAAGTDLAASALGTMKSADNSVISLVKTKVYEDKKKKSWFKKAKEYFWNIVGILYIAIVLIVNIAALPEIFGGDDNKYNEYDWMQDDSIPASEEVAEIATFDSTYYDEDEGDELSDVIDTYYLSGKIDGKYPIEMEMRVVNNYRVTWARYRYTKTGSGAWIDLDIDTDDFGRTLMYESLNGERVGRIEARLTCTGNSAELEGWHKNFKTGKELVFYADGVRK